MLHLGICGSKTNSFETSLSLSRLHCTLRRANNYINKILLHIQEGRGCVSLWIAFVFAFTAVWGSITQGKKS